LVIYEEKRSKDLDLLDSEEESVDEDRFTNYIAPKYVPHLIKIAANKARIIPSDSARTIFNNWRKEWRATQSQYNDKTGFVNRVPDHTLKVAMCLALSRYENNTTITEGDVTEAIDKISNLIYASSKAAEGTGLDPMAAQTKRVVDYLIAAQDNQLLRKELLVRGYGDYDPITLDKIIDALMEMGWVRRQKIGIGKNSDWLLLLAGEPKEKIMNFRIRGAR